MSFTRPSTAVNPSLLQKAGGALTAVPTWLNGTFPTTDSLDSVSWQRRHRVIVVLLALHAVALLVFGIAAGRGLFHALLECLAGIVAVQIACVTRLDRRARMLASSFGLITSSAVLVHLGGGAIEMHFHYFVALAIIGLYEDWLPFLGAIVFVLVSHGLLGVSGLRRCTTTLKPSSTRGAGLRSTPPLWQPLASPRWGTGALPSKLASVNVRRALRLSPQPRTPNHSLSSCE